ncbi:MAG: TauD/TfdA family dioxygenase [Pseudomonadota bacterium]
MKLAPIPNCDFGRLVHDWHQPEKDSANNLLEALHEHGILLFRQVDVETSHELATHVSQWFPSLNINPTRNRPADGGPVSVLGSTRDAAGQFNADYVPAATTGAPLLSEDGVWTDSLETSLTDWIRDKRECTFMEWHTDATFIPWPTSYAALYCRQPGASKTGFSDATDGFEQLPVALKSFAERAICTYRPSLIYGNPKLGIPAMASRSVQLSAMNENKPDIEADGSLTQPPHPDDPVVHHKLAQQHPHTGKTSLRFSLKSLETLMIDEKHSEPLPQREGKRIAWQIMRHATAGDRAYLHQWQTGDFIIWDERISMHCRVPYDAENQVREMWRMTFQNDPADQAFNKVHPQLNLCLGATSLGSE